MNISNKSSIISINKNLVSNVLIIDSKFSAEFLIILLIFESVSSIDYAFRNYHYAIIHFNWKLVNEKKKICVDAEYTIIIIDYTFISINAGIKKMVTKIFIRNLRFKIYHFDEYVVFIFYIKKVLSEDKRTFVEIIRKIYIVDDLKTKIFIEANIFISK